MHWAAAFLQGYAKPGTSSHTSPLITVLWATIPGTLKSIILIACCAWTDIAMLSARPDVLTVEGFPADSESEPFFSVDEVQPGRYNKARIQ